MEWFRTFARNMILVFLCDPLRDFSLRTQRLKFLPQRTLRFSQRAAEVAKVLLIITILRTTWIQQFFPVALPTSSFLLPIAFSVFRSWRKNLCRLPLLDIVPGWIVFRLWLLFRLLISQFAFLFSQSGAEIVWGLFPFVYCQQLLAVHL